MTDWRIPLSDLAYGDKEDAAVARVMASRWLSTGPEVAAFETEFAAMCGTTHALAVSSATAALHLALMSLGIGPGDEVVQPALNFVAAANVTRACGATPVFADIAAAGEPTVTAETIEPHLTVRTKAVVVMHYAGTPALMKPLLELCHDRGIAVIEDACHAVGARYADHEGVVGSLGDLACFSFFSNKNIATGEGGMVVTGHDDLAARCRSLRSHGMTTMSWDRFKGHAHSYDVVDHGLNYRMDDLHAALGRAQLSGLASNNAQRVELLDRYRGALQARGWEMPFGDGARPSSGHLAVVLAPDGDACSGLREALSRASIQSSLHYPLVTSFTAFADVARPLKVSGDFASRALTLPLHPGLTESEQEEIIAVVDGVARRPLP